MPTFGDLDKIANMDRARMNLRVKTEERDRAPYTERLRCDRAVEEAFEELREKAAQLAMPGRST